jgi:hypothetical protein
MLSARRIAAAGAGVSFNSIYEGIESASICADVNGKRNAGGQYTGFANEFASTSGGRTRMHRFRTRQSKFGKRKLNLRGGASVTLVPPVARQYHDQVIL